MPICSCSHACKHVASSNPHLAVACTFWVHIHSGKVVGPVSIGHDAWHIDQLLTDAVMKGILQCINSQQSLGTVPAGCRQWDQSYTCCTHSWLSLVHVVFNGILWQLRQHNCRLCAPVLSEGLRNQGTWMERNIPRGRWVTDPLWTAPPYHNSPRGLHIQGRCRSRLPWWV